MFVEQDATQSLKILLVEDDVVQSAIVKAAIAQLPQFDLLHVAEDGFAAIEFLKYTAGVEFPDVVLLDLYMPKRNGFEVLAELKAAPIFRRLPILVFSTSDAQEDIDRAYEEGANTYIVKPARLHDLKQVLAHVAGYWARAARLPTRSPMAC